MVRAAMQPRDPEHRVDVECYECGALDSAPRHRIFDIVDGQPTIIRRHMDCCRENGCPDGTCNRILDACGNLKNDELVAYVRSLTPGQHVEEAK